MSEPCQGPCNRRARRAQREHGEALTRWRDTAYHAALQAEANKAAARSGEKPPRIADPGPAPDGWDLTDTEAKHLGLPPHPEEPVLDWTDGEPLWCRRCTATVRHALGEIDQLAAVLESWSDGHRGGSSGERIHRGSSTSPASPSPIADLLDELYGDVTYAEDVWREHLGLLPVRRRTARGTHNRSSALAFIGQRLERVLAAEDWTEFAYRLLHWERRLQKRTKTDPVTRSRVGRCPRCELAEVLVTGPDDITRCQGCGLFLNEDEYQEKVVAGVDGALAADTHAARRGGR